jgi:hypothetical protein
MLCNSGQGKEQETRWLCDICKPLQRLATTDRTLLMSRSAERVRSSALFVRSLAGETEKGEKVVVPEDALVPAVCPVDDRNPRRAVTYYNYRFCTILSFVDLDGAPFRVIPVGGHPE